VLTQLYVQAETPGTCTVDLWLMFRCPQECGDWLAENGSAGDQVKVTVVAITESANPQPDPDRKLWWFNGENAANYAEQVTLTAQGITEGTFCWTVVAGADKVDLGNGQDTQTKVDDNTVMVISTGESYPQNDVEITLRINGQDVATHNMTVFTPGELLYDVSHDYDDGTWGYLSFIWYYTRDQFQHNLPAAEIELNERWTTDIQPDYAGMDWRRGDPGAAMVDPRSWRDSIQGELAGHNPEPQVPQTPRGTTEVYHWGQGWYVGSMTIGSGKHVQTNVLQKYRDHARHE
jgi:hypothetical protein